MMKFFRPIPFTANIARDPTSNYVTIASDCYVFTFYPGFTEPAFSFFRGRVGIW